jgi:hypothetical protein
VPGCNIAAGADPDGGKKHPKVTVTMFPLVGAAPVQAQPTAGSVASRAARWAQA